MVGGGSHEKIISLPVPPQAKHSGVQGMSVAQLGDGEVEGEPPSSPVPSRTRT
jgi:hypothetical protein